MTGACLTDQLTEFRGKRNQGKGLFAVAALYWLILYIMEATDMPEKQDPKPLTLRKDPGPGTFRQDLRLHI